MLTARLATVSDVLSMVGRLRPADLLEIKASGYEDPVEGLMVGLQSPDKTYVGVDEDDIPHIIFGTHPSDDPMVGYIWAMATDGLKKHHRQFLAQTQEYLKLLEADYKILTNYVHVENRAHIRWIRWANFSLLREVRVGNHRFIEFAKLTSNNNFNNIN